MDTSTGLADALSAVSRILLWCFVLGLLMLLFWLGAVVGFGDLAYQVHVNFFDLSKHEFNVIHYCGIVLAKLFVFLFFLFPWIATRVALSGIRGGRQG